MEDFWAKVDKSGECWLWTAGGHSEGYGTTAIKTDGEWRGVYAHRIAYELAVGPIPPGKEIHHVCGVRRCVNPAHLEAVTRGEHVRILYGNRHTPHLCPKCGGERVRKPYGWRCRPCGAEYLRRRYWEAKAA
jgi:predicted RNA-binding Zn-ribbon protein involved in translation (DUF1610 family)